MSDDIDSKMQELEVAIDVAILNSGLPSEVVADVLDMMKVRYEDDAKGE